MSSPRPRLLLVDNYDSYTYNLYQSLSRVSNVDVIKNDDPNFSFSDACDTYDGVVLSPGPGHPSNDKDVGHCRAFVRAILNSKNNNDNIPPPVLGVCLGHQLLALEIGRCRVERIEPLARHGIRSPVTIVDRDDPLFEGIPDQFRVVRYHSLHVNNDELALCSSELKEIGYCMDCEDNTGNNSTTTPTSSGLRLNMVLRHVSGLFYGVQFHPESIATEYGDTLLGNFVKNIVVPRTARRQRNAEQSVPTRTIGAAATSVKNVPQHENKSVAKTRTLFKDSCTCPRAAFDPTNFLKSLKTSHTSLFWLDSCGHARGRYHIFGASDVRESVVVRGDEITCYRRDGGEVCVPFSWEALNECLRFDSCVPAATDDTATASNSKLPFSGGWISFLGYELGGSPSPAQDSPTTADGVFLLAESFCVFDEHEEVLTFASTKSVDDVQVLRESWSRTFVEPTTTASSPPKPTLTTDKRKRKLVFTAAIPRDQYLDAIRRCQEYIQMGESYEICLTNQFDLNGAMEGESNSNGEDGFYLNFYNILRKINPAPYAGYVELGHNSGTLCCSSPERFLSIGSDGLMEAKPIKGTIPRGKTPAEDDALKSELAHSVKDRCENLMICDLLRNDLGHVSEVGSVRVPVLMGIESYATVHQMVSTVQSRKLPTATVSDVLHHSFPGGSITGAPKKRTIDILHQLERHKRRGFYTGSLGYIGFDGKTDLNILIRTAHFDTSSNKVVLGAGGAITALSDAMLEHEEIMWKVRPMCRALALYLCNDEDAYEVL
eukprot:PhM_4_TR3587/c0_g1_i1/m.10835/K13950/pabAB; para-aminobenzoate synthetase